MKSTFTAALFFLVMVFACAQEDREAINTEGMTLSSRINVPDGFARTAEKDGSFAVCLRDLPLKPDDAKVLLFDGREKSAYGVYMAVIDLPIGDKDLHQCADALMRLRAEYLWNMGLYSEIHFNFTNGFRVDYGEWMKGRRIAVNGNDTWWVEKKPPSNTYDDLWDYLQIIFSYAGTYSLSKELVPVRLEDMQIGDIFIKGGSPGHSVMVADMAEDIKSGKKIFLLIQSYMPAQEIQVLINPNDPDQSPWYPLDFSGKLRTPEWIFEKGSLMRFAD